MLEGKNGYQGGQKGNKKENFFFCESHSKGELLLGLCADNEGLCCQLWTNMPLKTQKKGREKPLES